jgi:hypothetical protein
VGLADVELDGDLTPGVAHAVAARGGLLFVFALGERATWRVLATRPVEDRPVPVGALQRLLDDAGLGARITCLAWSTVVRLQHRVARSYRRGPLFLAGDAAHAHSPAAAQGMNTGIQDAANLGWKLAFAAAGTDPDRLLASYEQERRPVGRQVVALTRAVFWAEASTDPLASFLRGVLAPLGAPVVPHVLRVRLLTATALRVLSQFGVSYRDSPLSVEGSPPLPGRPRAGDRLPDAPAVCDGRATRRHDLTARPGVHLLLQRDAAAPDGCRYVSVHRLTDVPGTGVTAVRPDGYVGFRAGTVGDGLRRWLAAVGAVGGNA